jgi:hypothetical protein
VALGDLILKFLPFMILVHYHEINLTGKSSNFVHHEFEGGRVTILAATDEEAKQRAKQLVDGHAVELWQEGRKVATFDSKKEGCPLSAANEMDPQELISLSGWRC